MIFLNHAPKDVRFCTPRLTITQAFGQTTDTCKKVYVMFTGGFSGLKENPKDMCYEGTVEPNWRC